MKLNAGAVKESYSPMKILEAANVPLGLYNTASVVVLSGYMQVQNL